MITPGISKNTAHRLKMIALISTIPISGPILYCIKVMANFGASNMVALIVPAVDYEKEKALLQDLDACPEVDYTMGLANIEALDGYPGSPTPRIQAPRRRNNARQSHAFYLRRQKSPHQDLDACPEVDYTMGLANIEALDGYHLTAADSSQSSSACRHHPTSPAVHPPASHSA